MYIGILHICWLNCFFDASVCSLCYKLRVDVFSELGQNFFQESVCTRWGKLKRIPIQWYYTLHGTHSWLWQLLHYLLRTKWSDSSLSIEYSDTVMHSGHQEFFSFTYALRNLFHNAHTHTFYLLRESCILSVIACSGHNSCQHQKDGANIVML